MENFYLFKKNNYKFLVVFVILCISQLAHSSDKKLITSKYNCAPSSSELTISPLRSGNWNNRAIWPNNTRPSLNDDVLIPEGMTITPFGNCFAKSLTIKGILSAVKTQENAAWFNITTEYIMVMGANAKLEIGTANQYYKSDIGAQITLLGTDPSKLIPGTTVNSKAIMVMGGAQVEMHGKPKTPWTQLGATVAAGSNIIKLKESVNWEVGDEIVIASTDFDMNHAETRIITAVNSNISFTLNEPLQYPHFGELQNYMHGKDSAISWTVDERAEVGLLSHNITIKGDQSSVENGYGGHMMCMPGSKMKAENIELYHMGQKATLGRYPWHWHLLQEGGTGLYLKNSSVHRTFNRAITIHGTNNTLVEGNVAYDNLGHAYFFEDGNEINNVMQYNLGLVTRRPSEADALLPSDIDNQRNMSGPATFWITHPHNKINFNHAAGSDGSGIWFAPHQNRNSAIYNPNLNPSHIPVPKGNWDNNVAHSSTHGLLVGPTVFPNDIKQRVNPNLDYYDAGAPTNEIVEVKNYTLYKNLLAAYMRIGQNEKTSKWENFIIADNYKGEALTWDGDMYHFLWVGASENYEPIPENAKAVGGAEGLVHLHTIYDGPSRVYNSHFAGVLPGMSLFDQWGANIKYVGHTLTNTTVAENSFHINWREFNNRPVWENATVVDVDGIFTALEPLTVMHKNIPILSNENTTILGTSNGAISSPLNKYCYVEIKPSDEIVFQQKRQRSVFTRSDGAVQEDNLIEIQGVSTVPMVNSTYTYQIAYENSIPAVSSMQYFSMDASDNVIIGYPGMPITATAYNRNLDTNEITQLTKLPNLEELKKNNKTSYAFEKGVMFVKYVAPNGAKFDSNGKIGQVEVCLYADCQIGENEPYKDTDGDNMFDYLEIVNCRNPESARDLSFDFNLSSEKFNTKDIDVKHKAEDNWLLRADFKTDPYIQRGGFAIDGNEFNKLRVRVKCDVSGKFELFWSNEDGTYSPSRSLNIDYFEANVWQELEFNFEGNQEWENKIISGLRIDFPVDSSRRVHTRIDYIKGEDDSTPPQLTPFSTVVGQPLKRTNTVDACTGSSVLFDFLGEFSKDWTFTFTSPNGKIFDGGYNGVNNDQLKLLNVTEDSNLQGTWTVNYINPEGCGNTETFVLNIFPTPELKQFIKLNDEPFQEVNSVFVEPGESVTFEMNGSINENWTFNYIRPDGREFAGGTNNSDFNQLYLNSVEENSVNEGEWIVNYTSPAGCSNSAKFTLSIEKTLSINEEIDIERESFNIYPNPATNYIQLLGNALEKNTIINLYSIKGKLISKHTITNSGKLKIDVQQLTDGMYFLLLNVNHKIKTKKFLVLK